MAKWEENMKKFGIRHDILSMDMGGQWCGRRNARGTVSEGVGTVVLYSSNAMAMRDIVMDSS